MKYRYDREAERVLEKPEPGDVIELLLQPPNFAAIMDDFIAALSVAQELPVAALLGDAAVRCSVERRDFLKEKCENCGAEFRWRKGVSIICPQCLEAELECRSREQASRLMQC